MPQSTILLAIKEFVDTHPDFPADYFNAEHRATTGFFGTKVYLVKEENGWTLAELNYLHLLVRQFSSILTFGYLKLYGNIDMNNFQSEIQPLPYETDISDKTRRLYEDLMTKALGPDAAWVDEINSATSDTFDEQSPLLIEPIKEIQEKIVPVDQQSQTLMESISEESQEETNTVDAPQALMDDVTSEEQEEIATIDEQPLSLMQIINKERQEKNVAVRKVMENKVLAIAKADYKNLFHGIDQMTNEQRASLVRLLSPDVKLSLGIWNGVMHHGKAFQLSARENVRTWIPAIIQALSLEQLTEACNDIKFWEVVDLFPEQVGTVLSLQQWTCIIENNKKSDSIVKLMLALPVDEMLYDKLLVACGRVPIDFGKELGMSMLISKLNRYLKAHKDERSTEVLTRAMKRPPSRRVTVSVSTPLNRKDHRSLTQPNLHLIKEKTPSRTVSFITPTNITSANYPRPPQWEDGEFYHVVNNLSQNVDNLKKAKILFWQLLERFPKEAGAEAQDLCQRSLKYLIRHYPPSVLEQMDGLNEVELQRFLTILEQTDAALIVGVWDSLMASARELGFSNELFARNKAQRILKHVSPQQLAASVSEDKLWAVLGHYPDLAGLLFTAEHLKILAAHRKAPMILAKIIADLPLNHDLGDKLAVICPHMVKDPMLEMQIAAKIRWYSANINKTKASELQRVIDEAGGVQEMDENSSTVFSYG
ncbi:hypothetical protein [Legionella maioricensis]|uniref:Uncharacterized protein n=1 Tax=Legionella maioricensis TaxID=2896528 RepID=A0A9X2ICG4_9GAMM|nr:hypothetical protein [Legionella maioricensis]MCL9684397.1 hypothetical protein [Legionella maioricensis]MCL9687578.1 hypothetical protein [Legionella maioricensis]